MNKKSNLRKLLDWEEKVEFNTDRVYTDEEEASKKHCSKSYYTDYKYNVFYEVGKVYKHLDSNVDNLVEKNDLYAVSNIF